MPGESPASPASSPSPAELVCGRPRLSGTLTGGGVMAEGPIAPECARCAAVQRKNGATHCWSSDPAAAPPAPGACPTRAHAETVAATLPGYLDGGVDARLARVEDTIAFARLMGWKKVGIATCIGLLDETARLEEILVAQGLEPVPVCCKVGSIDKERLGVKDGEKVRPGTFEPACNPVAQARILNELGTDMNVIVGLCVGHDMLMSVPSSFRIRACATGL